MEKTNASLGSREYQEVEKAIKLVDKYGFFGGTQYTSPNKTLSKVSLDNIRTRELKWIEMIENWDRWMSKHFSKVKERCRKGIPDSLRSKAWQLLSGSYVSLSTESSRFKEYLESEGDRECLMDIKKDVNRQYPHHELFTSEKGQGQEDLFSILKAYSVHRPDVGYCQAQAPLAALLLTIMPVEQAFWCFTATCDSYLPGYYSHRLEAVHIDSLVLMGLMKKTVHIAYSHLESLKVDPLLWMVEWFMCVFARTLPWPTLLRVWDMFYCEGVKVLFLVALTIVKSVLGTKEQCLRSPTLYETLDCLKKVPPHLLSEEVFIPQMLKISLSGGEMEKEHKKQVKKWSKKTSGVERNRSMLFNNLQFFKIKKSTKSQNKKTVTLKSIKKVPEYVLKNEVIEYKETNTENYSKATAIKPANLLKLHRGGDGDEATSVGCGGNGDVDNAATDDSKWLSDNKDGGDNYDVREDNDDGERHVAVENNVGSYEECEENIVTEEKVIGSYDAMEKDDDGDYEDVNDEDNLSGENVVDVDKVSDFEEKVCYRDESYMKKVVTEDKHVASCSLTNYFDNYTHEYGYNDTFGKFDEELNDGENKSEVLESDVCVRSDNYYTKEAVRFEDVKNANVNIGCVKKDSCNGVNGQVEETEEICESKDYSVKIEADSQEGVIGGKGVVAFKSNEVVDNASENLITRDLPNQIITRNEISRNYIISNNDTTNDIIEQDITNNGNMIDDISKYHISSNDNICNDIISNVVTSDDISKYDIPCNGEMMHDISNYDIRRNYIIVNDISSNGGMSDAISQYHISSNNIIGKDFTCNGDINDDISHYHISSNDIIYKDTIRDMIALSAVQDVPDQLHDYDLSSVTQVSEGFEAGGDNIKDVGDKTAPECDGKDGNKGDKGGDFNDYKCNVSNVEGVHDNLNINVNNEDDFENKNTNDNRIEDDDED